MANLTKLLNDLEDALPEIRDAIGGGEMEEEEDGEEPPMSEDEAMDDMEADGEEMPMDDLEAPPPFKKKKGGNPFA